MLYDLVFQHKRGSNIHGVQEKTCSFWLGSFASTLIRAKCWRSWYPFDSASLPQSSNAQRSEEKMTVWRKESARLLNHKKADSSPRQYNHFSKAMASRRSVVHGTQSACRHIGSWSLRLFDLCHFHNPIHWCRLVLVLDSKSVAGIIVLTSSYLINNSALRHPDVWRIERPFRQLVVFFVNRRIVGPRISTVALFAAADGTAILVAAINDTRRRFARTTL